MSLPARQPGPEPTRCDALPPHLSPLAVLERVLADLAAGRPLAPDDLAEATARLRASVPAKDWKHYQAHRAALAHHAAGLSLKEAARRTAREFGLSPRVVERLAFGWK